MQSIKFSIGIPAFKGKFFGECLQSVILQSYHNFELIIVDDCSPDDLKSIVDKFGDPRIMYSKNNINTGAENVVDNWNKCLEVASGDYFVLMGDDDRMELNYLEEFVSLIEKYQELDVFHCRSKIIDQEGKTLSLTQPWPEFENVYDNILYRISEKRTQYISDFVYRLSTLKEKGGFYKLPLAWGSDDISAYIACGKKGIAHTNKSVFNYRTNNLSITSSGNFLLKLEANKLYGDWIASLLKSDLVTNDLDSIIAKQELKTNLEYHLRRRNNNAMAKAINKSALKDCVTLIKVQRKFNLSFYDITIIILKVIKKKILNENCI